MQNLKQVTITFKDGTSEQITDVLGFNFFGNVMIFDISDGKTYQVRQTSEITKYVVKGQPVKNKKK